MNLPDKIYVVSKNFHGNISSMRIFIWNESGLLWENRTGNISLVNFDRMNLIEIKTIFTSHCIYSLDPITEDIINLWKIQ